MRDRLDLRRAADGDGLEAELAATEELLGQDRVRFARAQAPRGLEQLLERADAEGRLGAHPGRRLEHHREADLPGEGARVGVVDDQTIARDRQAGGGERGLHPRLVAEEVGDLGGRAGDAEVGPRLRQLDD